MIRIDNLTKIFDTPDGPVTATDRISMEVPEGEVCILLGPSGCGKTTTLKMINRIIEPTAGKVYIDGEDTTGLDTVDLRRNIGYVIQQIGLFPNMTIEENIAVVPRLLGWDRQRCRERVKELLEMVAMDPAAFLKRYPNELSGGQQQRVGVVRALAADPPVLLMDEPFGAIDPINRAVIQDEFLRMQSELRKTVMFVSHDVDEAVKMGDRIAVFRQGRLVQYDRPDDLLSHPRDAFVESFFGEDRALKRLQLVSVAEVMEDEVPVVHHDDGLDQALRLMDARGYHYAITMVNEHRQPVGMVLRSTAESRKGICGEHYEGIRASAHVNDDLRKAVALMLSHDTTWMPCVDDEGRLCGTITQRGITRHLAAAYRTQE